MTRLEHLQSKIVDPHTARQRICTWNLLGNRVVFTNGCFDILHEGHITYLAQAANLGERLVVALNTDASVKRQGKGDDRPVNSEASRALLIAALGFVDLVVFFNEDTPLELIEQLQPDVLAKGADYDPNERDPSSKKFIVGSVSVLKSGGEVHALPLVEGFSTTAILEKLKK